EESSIAHPASLAIPVTYGTYSWPASYTVLTKRIPLQTQMTDLLPDPPLPPTDQSPIEHPSTLRNIFFGDEGLRAGWSILLFAALFGAFMSVSHLIAVKIHPPTHQPSNTMPFYFMFLNESIPLLGVCLVTWIMSKVE